MFIHWGLYAIPAGAWPGQGDHHGEWIRDTARIPRDEYARLAAEFNPTGFDADEWVRMAADAGMRYLVITSKHHDGFCLFDSAHTDFTVMRTPFGRDIMAELAAACVRSEAQGAGVRFAMYHSIMDWHHEDYLPRRPWERGQRTEAGAAYERYVAYLGAQIDELLSVRYDPGIIWFDGEWEGTWTSEHARRLHAQIRLAAPHVIMNNRIDKGRAGMDGHTIGAGFLGDYDTPEQTIPERGLVGDWETCMTMNGHWGYNARDTSFKSAADLVQKLCDIASKGGNFLLNVGPTAQGLFPKESVDRLREIGAWMRINGEAIHGTRRSPLPEVPSWGRVTTKRIGSDTRLYLHLFRPPVNNEVRVPGLLNEPIGAFVLQAPERSRVWRLEAVGEGEGVVVRFPAAPDETSWNESASVVVLVLDVRGEPDIASMPTIGGALEMFVGEQEVEIGTAMRDVVIRYELGGGEPGETSKVFEAPLLLRESAVVRARAYRDGKAVGPVASRTFERVEPVAAVAVEGVRAGLAYEAFEGSWNRLPEFDRLMPVARGHAPGPTVSVAPREDEYGLRFSGFLRVPADGVYTFYLSSDDGSRLFVAGSLVVDNDGLHSVTEKYGHIPLRAGLHAVTVEMFEKTGSEALELSWSGPGVPRQAVPAQAYFHTAED